MGIAQYDPAALGACIKDVWSEIWPDVEPIVIQTRAVELTFGMFNNPDADKSWCMNC